MWVPFYVFNLYAFSVDAMRHNRYFTGTNTVRMRSLKQPFPCGRIADKILSKFNNDGLIKVRPYA